MTSMPCVAVVTGAGSGIGRAASVALLEAGFHVVVAGRRAGALADTLAVAGAHADRGLALPTDVTDPASVSALMDVTTARLGRIDVLFNNAGIFSASEPIEAIGLDAWNAAVATNLTGAFLCAQAAYRAMQRQVPRGGRIINNGSLSAHVPRPFAAAYTATKHAVTGLTKALALEGRRYDIACGQIDVGNAATELTAGLAQGVPQADGSVAPEPVIDARHVADAVVAMAQLPLDANVASMTLMATAMPYVGRG
jgi:NAD(P)-dependent dehydrogenase (short-subunit alcohol dehydrogenase family)